MCEEFLKASTLSPNKAFREHLSFHTIITEPTYDDIRGLLSAYQEARLSRHTTQVGAYVAGISAHNRQDIGGHAESWAIATCARLGIRTENQTMYAPWASCKDCALDIVAAGIRRVVTHSVVMDLTPARWQHSVQRGLDLLHDRGVQVDMVDKQLGGIKIMFDGKEVEV